MVDPHSETYTTPLYETTMRSSKEDKRILCSSNDATSNTPPFIVSLISGGIAGTTVDIALYPIDTLKTRLQSPQGFWKSGGFRGVYKGLSVAATGSSPGAALFFSTYDTMKHVLEPKKTNLSESVSHMLAASCGEIIACLVRVPTEVLKQRMQVSVEGNKIFMTSLLRSIIKNEGVSGLYSGFGITIMREIPFACIQFPLYELLKKLSLEYRGTSSAVEGALFGCVSGAIAAALTTPLDVLKTRIMLGKDSKGVRYVGLSDTLSRIIKDEGAKTLFSGVVPRVFWISIGGFVFFGAYEQTKRMLIQYKGNR